MSLSIKKKKKKTLKTFVESRLRKFLNTFKAISPCLLIQHPNQPININNPAFKDSVIPTSYYKFYIKNNSTTKE